MDDDAFNMSKRIYLKKVGVTSQQQIEEAVRSARDAGTLPAGPLSARIVLTVPEIGLEHEVTGEIALKGSG